MSSSSQTAGTLPTVGISAFANYLPAYQVSLDSWCNWTGEQWDKIRHVVGSSFRMVAANENANTMAATAVLRLIRQNNIDPTRIRFLALGTESSTDNAAGAIVVKGMVNDGLAKHGLPPLHRACEVPEFKHACLGGIYAMKAAARFLAFDGQDHQAIVVSSDVAEYQRGSSGEPTQGAGAVAMLLEANPKMLSLQLQQAGSSSDYRGVDFRKPISRFADQQANAFGQLNDFPVFNGKYSTNCYIDEVLAAMRELFSKIDEQPSKFLRRMAGVFLHRPYQRMAETGLIMSYLLALAMGGADDQQELATYAAQAGVDPTPLNQELTTNPLIAPDQDPYPLATQAARSFRSSNQFADLQTSLGVAAMQEVGNLYTASLPAWLAAGLEQAAKDGLELAGQQILTIGYGSGDAAEAIPLQFVPGWETAAQRIGFATSLSASVELTEAEYVNLHAGADNAKTLPASGIAQDAFYIERIGGNNPNKANETKTHIDDQGIEYYALNS